MDTNKNDNIKRLKKFIMTGHTLSLKRRLKYGLIWGLWSMSCFMLMLASFYWAIYFVIGTIILVALGIKELKRDVKKT